MARKYGKPKRLLSPKERVVAKLEQMVKVDYAHQHLTEEEREKSRSLLRQYIRDHDLTGAQWGLARSLVKLHRKLGSVNTNSDWMLYAMKAGDTVKLGHTSNIGARIKSIQTGQADRVELKWTLSCEGRVDAKNKERKLHRFCRDRHIRGEWFAPDVLERLEAFH